MTDLFSTGEPRSPSLDLEQSRQASASSAIQAAIETYYGVPAFVIEGRAVLLHGDAYALIPKIAAATDPAKTALITDPPYDFNMSGGGGFRKGRYYQDEIEDRQLTDGFDTSFISPARYAAAVIFCHDNQTPALWTRLRTLYHRARLLLWRKTNPIPVFNGNYVPETEHYLHAWLPHAKPQGDYESLKQVWSAPVAKNSFEHPTVKPLPLIEKIVGNVGLPAVVDPFMGTGTTGVAAVRQGRFFIGVERAADWFEIACQRVTEAARERGTPA